MRDFIKKPLNRDLLRTNKVVFGMEVANMCTL